MNRGSGGSGYVTFNPGDAGCPDRIAAGPDSNIWFTNCGGIEKIKEITMKKSIGTKLVLSCAALIGGLCLPVHAQNPAIAVRSTGEADVVMPGNNGQLMYYWAWPGSQWNSTMIAGPGSTGVGSQPSNPAIAIRSNGEADVVATAPNGQLMYYWATPGSQWNSTQIAGPHSTGSSPSIAVRSTGEVDVVAIAPNGQLMYYWAWPGSKWNSTMIAGPGSTLSLPAFNPAIAVRSTGEADVVATAPNGQLMYYWAWPGSQWNSTMIAGPGSTWYSPAIAVRSSGEADVVAESTNGALMYYWATPGSRWNSTQISDQGFFGGNPAIAVRSSGEVDVVATNQYEALVYFWATPGSQWRAQVLGLDGWTLSGPAIAVRSSGEADVVAVEVGGLTYFRATPGSAWQSTNIGGP
jgi:hypothetical protein